MKLYKSKAKNGTITYYVQKGFRVKREDGTSKSTTKNIERLGTHQELLDKGIKDPEAWALAYIEELNKKAASEKPPVISLQFDPSKLIPSGKQALLNCGYLFLQSIYYDLGLHEICYSIGRRRQYEFNLNEILSRLVYCRVLFPASKHGTFKFSKTLIEQPSFELHQIYRALSVLAEENAFIQAQLYKNSKKYAARNDRILYYDCTNFFFETEQAEGLKQYGYSKEHRPLPIVQLGLFMDADGIPLAFSVHNGNTNEQTTLKPLEKQIIQDFSHSKFTVCTDAGLSSGPNRWFNNISDRAFITTVSLKAMAKERSKKLREPTGWKLSGTPGKTYNIDEIGSDEALRQQYFDAVFYKEEWFIDDIDDTDRNGNSIKRKLPQRFIVTFSFKYQQYQKKIRDEQLKRAAKAIRNREPGFNKKNMNDYHRFIRQIASTGDGEIAEERSYYIDEDQIANESQYDGFYAVATSLEDDAVVISKISHDRWQIEESFRIMKSEFRARPVYLSRDDRICAHFLTCFLALYVYRYLEKRLGGRFSCQQTLTTLRNMSMYKVDGDGYIPAYTRTELTDALHEEFGFHTDYEIVPQATMKKIFSQTKNRG